MSDAARFRVSQSVKSRGDTAAKSVANSSLLSLLSGLMLTAIYLAFSDGIITVFGGTVNKETYNYSKEGFPFMYSVRQ